MNNDSLKQENSGAYQRVSGKDYYELHLHLHFHMCDACAKKNYSSMQSDERYEIEKNFKNRFGFALNAELCLLVIRLKEEFKLTDSEIILLKRSGALTVKKGRPITLYSDWIGLSTSVILMFLCTLLVPLFASAVFMRGNNLALEVLFVAVLSAIYFFFCKDLHRLSVKPAKILYENGIKLGQKYTLPI